MEIIILEILITKKILKILLSAYAEVQENFPTMKVNNLNVISVQDLGNFGIEKFVCIVMEVRYVSIVKGKEMVRKIIILIIHCWDNVKVEK